MKKIILTAACLFISNASFAGSNFVTKKLSCGGATTDDGTPQMRLAYSLDCTVQDGVSKHSLGTCELYKSAYPGGLTEKFDFVVKRQSEENAKLESQDGTIQIRIHKSDLSAIVILPHSYEVECEYRP